MVRLGQGGAGRIGMLKSSFFVEKRLRCVLGPYPLINTCAHISPALS